jgi:hypothetical protein
VEKSNKQRYRVQKQCPKGTAHEFQNSVNQNNNKHPVVQGIHPNGLSHTIELMTKN